MESDKARHIRHDRVAGALFLVEWIGAIATSFAIRGEYQRRIQSPLFVAETEAEARLRARAEATALARVRPELAEEMGVGRPDRPGAFDAGVVDVNNAPAKVLRARLGTDAVLAKEIVQKREENGGFSSLEDLGLVLDLPGDVVERLRGKVIFLPRH
jgi:DNA uptake protein ComE-like DNA-binding protein